MVSSLEKRIRKLMIGLVVALALAITLALVCGFFMVKERRTSMSQPLIPPVRNITAHVRHWQCDEGKTWKIDRNVVIAVCRNAYVDIRETLNDIPTIKGIKLNIAEWHGLASLMDSVNHALK